ncbi:bacillithiol system redox-active protein YtxJ [Bacillus aquiflavi]|uniref:Bacillithiol system redox-active protein YtxJ n=1 Tax=Bacillus aquiflavi TaxID=2672567 RepID=A0A6B3VXE2_9BACI|nr:bacillithiol system redox-active protein YtxJ [Bacillus aquiflavi]MBA4537701.1 bacillithiol system redox-active protein YtxJ [Bacillus aquiflavi]NEY81958.1 bacillithiol system redox-active protein YtxJ [Bacillus aquiflavi]
MEKIDSVTQFEKVLEQNERVILLKHSNTCPVSQGAFEEYEKFLKEHSNLTGYYLVVQEARPLSNHIAETFHIKHESPQAIIFLNHQVVWHESHWNITFESLLEAIKNQ